MKYRADSKIEQSDGAICWHAEWLGGPTLAKVNNCRWESLEGSARYTVYITGDADTYFSIPAYTVMRGKRVRGYITLDDDGNKVFHHCYY